MKVTSALPFDCGVDLVVIGLCLMAFEAFGDEQAANDPATIDDRPASRPPTRRSPDQ